MADGFAFGEPRRMSAIDHVEFTAGDCCGGSFSYLNWREWIVRTPDEQVRLLDPAEVVDYEHHLGLSASYPHEPPERCEERVLETGQTLRLEQQVGELWHQRVLVYRPGPAFDLSRGGGLNLHQDARQGSAIWPKPAP
jgi:hypothetical protein